MPVLLRKQQSLQSRIEFLQMKQPMPQNRIEFLLTMLLLLLKGIDSLQRRPLRSVQGSWLKLRPIWRNRKRKGVGRRRERFGGWTGSCKRGRRICLDLGMLSCCFKKEVKNVRLRSRLNDSLEYRK